MNIEQEVVLVGHPFAPIGRGEDVRCTYRALRSVGVRPAVLDVYGLQEPDGPLQAHIRADLTRGAGRVNIFHINGDEIGPVLKHLDNHGFSDKYNIVYPAWELSDYPAEWAKGLERFDEIWAPSRFIEAAVRSSVSKPLFHMPLACEVVLDSMLSRASFGIPETPFVFLFSFDFRSWAIRKNPEAVLACFERLIEELPTADAMLVVKVHGDGQATPSFAGLKARLDALGTRAMLIDRSMSDNEIRNLIRCSDCFVSLHRSEGFGRGMGEAMFLGKPVIATGYSGNLDFMDNENSLLVDAGLVPLKRGEYPFWEGQSWAEPDKNQAISFMKKLVSDREAGRMLGRKAAISIRRSVGFRTSGVRYAERLKAVRAQTMKAGRSVA